MKAGFRVFVLCVRGRFVETLAFGGSRRRGIMEIIGPSRGRTTYYPLVSSVSGAVWAYSSRDRLLLCRRAFLLALLRPLTQGARRVLGEM